MISEAPVTFTIIILFCIWFVYRTIKTFNNIQKIKEMQEKLLKLNIRLSKQRSKQ